MYKLFITLRYLRARLVSYVAAGVLALGVAVLIIVTSVMSGFQREYHKKVRGKLADVTVKSRTYFGIFDPENLRNEIERSPRVLATAPFVETISLIDTDLQKDWGFLEGIDPEREVEVAAMRDSMLSDREVFEIPYEQLPSSILASEEVQTVVQALSADKPDPARLLREPTLTGYPPLLAGSQLLYHLNLRAAGTSAKGARYAGDVVNLLATNASRATETGQIREEDTHKGTFEVVGVLETGIYDNDRRLMVAELSAAQRFLNLGRRVSGINVKVTDYQAAEEIADEIKEHLFAERDLGIKSWSQRNKNLMQAVEIERFMVYFIVVFMMLLAAFALSAIMTMSVIEKTKDLGILGAVGATRWGRFSIFVWQGGLIGLLGAAVGTLIGYLFVDNINWIDRNIIARVIGKRVFDPSVYYLDKIPAEIDPSTVVWCVVPTILIGFLVSLYPAMRAARLDPLEALRYE